MNQSYITYLIRKQIELEIVKDELLNPNTVKPDCLEDMQLRNESIRSCRDRLAIVTDLIDRYFQDHNKD